MNRLQWLAMITLMGAVSSARSSEYVTYSGPESIEQGEITYRIDSKRGITSSADSSETAFFCPGGSNYYCFDDGALVFYVPKKRPNVGDTWKEAGRVYKLERTGLIGLLGKKLPVVVISSVSDKHNTVYYYYSFEHGLIAIKVLPGKDIADKCYSSDVLFLVGESGFPFE